MAKRIAAIVLIALVTVVLVPFLFWIRFGFALDAESMGISPWYLGHFYSLQCPVGVFVIFFGLALLASTEEGLISIGLSLVPIAFLILQTAHMALALY